MSRVGRRPIEIPKEVKVELDGRMVTAEAKGRKLSHIIPETFKMEMQDGKLTVIRPSDAREHKSLHGTTRTLISNMVEGLTKGFQKKLVIEGVGYRAQMKGKTLSMELGFSHTVEFVPPEGIDIETPSNTEIIVKGVDKQKVGAVSAEIRAYYPPEPYKGKGIRYDGEYVRRKQGKSIA